MVTFPPMAACLGLLEVCQQDGGDWWVPREPPKSFLEAARNGVPLCVTRGAGRVQRKEMAKVVMAQW